MKKWLSMILVLCMAVAMLAGCGKDDDDEDKKSKSSVKKGDAFDMLEEMGNTTSGEYQIGFDFDIPDSKVSKMNGTINLKTDGSNCSLGLVLDMDDEGQKLSISTADLLIVADGNLYLNLPEFVKAAGSIEKSISDIVDSSKLGWFKLPLPDDLPKLDTSFQKKLVGSFVGLFENMSKKANIDGDDGDMTISFENKEAWAEAFRAVSAFVKNDFKGIVNSCIEKTQGIKIDFNKYAEKLIDTYKSEVVEIGKDYGLDEQTIDMYVQQIKSMDLNEKVAELQAQGENASSEFISDEEIAEIGKKLDELATKAESSEKELKAFIKGHVYTTDDSYKAEFFTESKEEGAPYLSVKLEVIPGDPGVKAPGSDVMTLKQIADIAEPFIKMGGGIDDPDPTPTPTEVPADPTPIPTVEPADPTPTTEPDSGTKTSLENGKGVIVCGSGGTVTFDYAGTATVGAASTDSLTIVENGIGCSIMTFDYSMYTKDVIRQSYASYGEVIDYGDWMLVDVTQAKVGIIYFDDGVLLQVTAIGEFDDLKNILDNMSNVKRNK